MQVPMRRKAALNRFKMYLDWALFGKALEWTAMLVA